MTPPVTQVYFDQLSDSFVGRFYQNVEGILEKYRGNKDVRYIDFTHHGDFGLDDFRNFDHLNRWGAERFTAILEERIRRIWEMSGGYGP